ncbi:polyphosphate kinase 2 [Candidatus Gracilibacteria bacterium]|nr:polyphosphate kinase 2 [Candidatus Gracilibacteria bacterium]NUJ99198.1 polyphosphate kinase 2 [Candidatus Gracilibacteria bacterium]
MPSIFYEIFNDIIKLNAKTLGKFKENVKELFKQLKEEKDIDNLKVLRNRLSHLLKEQINKVDKKTKKGLKGIENIIDSIDEFIDSEKETAEKEIKPIDVVKKIEKRYQVCEKIPEEKRNKYVPVCIKKDEVDYEKEIIELQLELVKLQKYIKESGQKLLIIFEGRDAAGKGGNIKRFNEYLNPRGARVVALEKPTDLEKTQWYFQRYISHLPHGGEMVFFDRSWYNRAGVEPVMGFVKKKDYEQFLDDVPKFEKMLIRSGVKIIKFYFSVSKDEQAKRFDERQRNPLKQYKLSPVDQLSQKLWDRYTIAEYHNFTNTHTDYAPWTIINSDDKKKSRINAMKYLLNQFDYPGKIKGKKLEIDTKIVLDGSQKIKKLAEEINTDKDLFE